MFLYTIVYKKTLSLNVSFIIRNTVECNFSGKLLQFYTYIFIERARMCKNPCFFVPYSSDVNEITDDRLHNHMDKNIYFLDTIISGIARKKHPHFRPV